MEYKEEFQISDQIKKKLSIKESDYYLSVEGFSDWIEAIEEIEIARVKTRVAKLILPESSKSILETKSFPSWLTRAADLIIFALLLKYPKGITKDELAIITGMKETSLVTLLTSKEKKLAEYLTKNDNSEYSLLTTSLHWVINQLETQKEK